MRKPARYNDDTEWEETESGGFRPRDPNADPNTPTPKELKAMREQRDRNDAARRYKERQLIEQQKAEAAMRGPGRPAIKLSDDALSLITAYKQACADYRAACAAKASAMAQHAVLIAEASAKVSRAKLAAAKANIPAHRLT